MSLRNAVLDAIEMHQSEIDDAKAKRICNTWHKAMQANGIDEQVATQALEQITYTTKFMPKPADVIELVRGGSDTKALAGWVNVIKVAKTTNAIYRPTIFDDPQIHYTIATMGGWADLYNQITSLRHIGESLQWIKKDFIASYKACRTGKYKMLIAYGDGKGRKPIVIGSRDECKRLLTVAKDKQLNSANETIKRLAQGKGTE